ncbi:unnamed protein product [Rotaria sp. Silwood2]|nr:unnamed protein product [Rotaria sp. Silwood2]CAF4139097.1 unnamed protein product [Rotaria sp. Silwood2]CAF4335818.1 unnamed protein product [Rotaria sp. Silwood2]
MAFFEMNASKNDTSSHTFCDNLYTNIDTSLPSLPISVTKLVRTTNSAHHLDLQQHNADEKRSLLRKSIRYVMRTFYDVLKSLVEYNYYYESINLQDLANCLCLSSKEVHSYIKQCKHDKYIKEEHRSKLKVVKYRLIDMQSAIANFER